MRVRQKSRQTLAFSVDSDEHLDQQDALHGETVRTFGSDILPEFDVENRIFGGEQETAVASLQEIQRGPEQKGCGLNIQK